MRWTKHGIVWRPSGERAWARTHATCATPVRLADGTLRVFVQCRDAGNVGRIGFVDLDPENPRRVLREAAAPVLDVGAPGAFDDNGVFPTSVVSEPGGGLLLYYVGFELCHHIRYRLLTGLARSDDGGLTFRRVTSVPVLERSEDEPHIRGGAFVRRHGDVYRMWYVAGGAWESIGGKDMPIYDVRLLESHDGVQWPPTGRVVVAIDHASEHGFGRPYVVPDGAGFRMHYSIRKRSPARYRMGLAVSTDGVAWVRRDEDIGLDVSSVPWENDSVEYGAEFDAAGRTWLLYNGNDFGADGLCLAERVDG